MNDERPLSRKLWVDTLNDKMNEIGLTGRSSMVTDCRANVPPSYGPTLIQRNNIPKFQIWISSRLPGARHRPKAWRCQLLVQGDHQSRTDPRTSGQAQL